jgi:HD-like signal output (HDOD) protein
VVPFLEHVIHKQPVLNRFITMIGVPGMQRKDEKIIEEELKNMLVLIDDSDISSIKSIVTELIRLINDPKSNAKDLKAVIEMDPLLSAKLLKLANSAYYGFSKTISDIQEAVVCVGFDNLKELALNQQIRQLFEDDDIIAGYSRSLLWKHCVAVALFCKILYQNTFREKSGNIYVVGLLHDIGIIIEEQFLMNEFFQILDDVNSGDDSYTDVEEAVLGYNHADIGRAVAIGWNFPEELSTAIGYHHSPDKIVSTHSKIASTLFIADYVCHKQGIGYSYAKSQDHIAFEACRNNLREEHKVIVEDDSLDAILSEVVDKIAQMESAGWF